MPEAARVGKGILRSVVQAVIEQRGARCDDFRPLLVSCEDAPRVEIPWTSDQLEDPYLIGWVFLLNSRMSEPKANWAISRKGETEMQPDQVASATRIFTDEYLARLVVDAGWRDRGSEIQSVCDPSCGAGHLLVTVLQRFIEAGLSADDAVKRIFGFDLDPAAVEVARAAVLVEALRLGWSRNPSEMISILQQQIRAVAGPIGTLDRAIELPGAPYDLIVMNPPYLGRRKMPAEVNAYLRTNFPHADGDLCVAFLARALDLLNPNGDLSWVGMNKWRTLRNYERFRSGDGASWDGFLQRSTVRSIRELGSRAFREFSTLHDGVSVSIVHVSSVPPSATHEIDLLEGISARSEKTGRKLLQSVLLTGGDGLDRDLFSRLAVSAAVTPLSERARVVVGAQTSDDRRFVRYHWEIPRGTPGWIPHLKGGGYSRWAGQDRWVIDVRDTEDSFIHQPAGGWRAIKALLEKPGYTYSWLANGALGVRVRPAGFSIGRAASSGVFFDDVRLLAVLNSRVASYFVRRMGGKLQLTEGTVKRLPCPEDLSAISTKLVEEAITLKQRLVGSQPEEYSFRPELLITPSEYLRAEERLLICEADLDRQVERAFGIGAEGIERLDQEFGRLSILGHERVAGSNPLPACGILESLLCVGDDSLTDLVARLREDLEAGRENQISAHCNENVRISRLLEISGFFGQPGAPLRRDELIQILTRSGLLAWFSSEYPKLERKRFRGVPPWTLDPRAHEGDFRLVAKSHNVLPDHQFKEIV